MSESTSRARTTHEDMGPASPAKRALLAMRDVRAELDALRGRVGSQIAIIGMGCRFPGASSPQAFWEMLRGQGDGVSEVPAERWDSARFFHPDARTPGKITGRWGGFLEHLDQFDAAFFGISPREAPHVDPRQRKVMEIAWEALEDAGIPPLGLAGSATGIYIATLSSDYDTILCRNYGRISASTGTGTANSIIANRLSYFLDLRGPSLTLDTACSGSLLGIELACRSLRTGESSLAIAGGVSINLLPKGDVFFSAAGALSPTGSCKAFDAEADGIVRSEGAGVVVLKRLDDAMEDGDRIYAVIRGGAINHDGASNGIMAPNGEAQKRVLRAAYRNAGVVAGDVHYVETHGTGTPLGDPLEIGALAGAMAEGRDGKPLVLGSLKTNVGHMEAAAGVASVIKVALALHHGELPPNRGFTRWNPRIPEVPFPIEALTEVKAWPANGMRRLAGVSAFSFGGTNAHLVLEEAPERASSNQAAQDLLQHRLPQDDRDNDRRSFVLPLSAKSPAALEAMVRACRDYLQSGAAGSSLGDVCFTAASRRSHHPYRFAAAASSLEEMSAKLREKAEPQRKMAKLAFVFSGQGSHWKGMGESLFVTEPVFRAVLEKCDAVLRELAGYSVIEEIASGEGLNRTAISQGAVFSMQVALFELWRSWGVEPDAVIGQSLGEAAAAYASGALSLEAAAAVVYHRSRLMNTLAGRGRTAVLRLAPEAALDAIAPWEGDVSLAGRSAPDTTLVSGTPEAISAMVGVMEAQGITAQVIAGVDVALHHPQMETLRGELEQSLGRIDCGLAKTAMMSTVTASWLNGNRPDARYWGENLCRPFQLAGALTTLIGEGFDGFLEISPHTLLGSPIRQVLAQNNAEALILESLRRREEGNQTIMASLAALYAAGRYVNWSAVYATGQVVSLPPYPWQRERYWLDQLPGGTAPSGETSLGHPLLGERSQSALPGGQTLWEQGISLTSPYYLSGHRVFGNPVFPGAGYVEAVLAALLESRPDASTLEVSRLRFHEGMALPAESSYRMQTAFSPVSGDSYDFQVSGRQSAASDWTNHASGRASVSDASGNSISAQDVRRRTPESISGQEHYEAMARQGLEYGANFRAIQQIWRGPGEAVAELELDPAAVAEAHEYCIHPILLDAALQLVAATIEPGEGNLYSTESYLPQGLDRVLFHCHADRTSANWRGLGRVTCIAKLMSGQPGAPEIVANLQLIDDSGRLTLEVEGLRLAHVGAAKVGAPGRISDWLYELCWEEKPPVAASARTGSWTIIADKGGFATTLATTMRNRGVDCVVMAPDEEGLKNHLADMAAGVAYLCGLDKEDDPWVFPLRLIKRLAASGQTPAVWFVTRGTQAADGKVPELSRAAELWGFDKVVALEHPEMHGGVIDLDPSREDDVEQIVDQLLAPDSERQVAFRQGKRMAARLRPWASPANSSAVVLRGDAAYLITGGLGGLGLAVGRWMVQRGARRLILAGRTPLPARGEWRSLEAEHPAKSKIDSLRELERMGASVHIANFDVGNAAEVEAFLQSYQSEDWPPIRGVVHAAGVIEDQFVVRLEEQSFANVLRPKVEGSLALHQATQNLDLDFFTLYSSISSVLGQYGQAHYAAGNAFLDHLAHWRRSRGLPATTINWGPWAEVGLFAKLQTVDKSGRSGVFPMLSEQALQAMERMQRAAPAQIMIVSADWSRIPPSPLQSELAQHDGSAGSVHDQPSAAMLLELLVAEPEERQQRLEKYLTGLAADVLKLNPAKLVVSEPLTAFGMDSIMVVELKHNIEKDLGLSIAIVDLFTASITKLAEQLSGKLANDNRLAELLEQVENMSAQELEELLGETKDQ
ncbi:MAG: type I polyketide synthase [Acidobacteriaceae bacterium]